MRRAMMALCALGAIGALAACRAPPRAVSYFKAHPRETLKVLAACSTGTHRGAECDNAKAGESQIESDRRLTFYKTSF